MTVLVVWGVAQPASPQPDWTRQPEVIVMLFVQPEGNYVMTWTYNRRVPHAQARQQVEAFTRWTGRTIANLEIGDDSLKRNAKPNELMTVVSFASGGLVNLAEGTIDLNPILRTFADAKTLQVYVALPRAVDYKGYYAFATPRTDMWTVAEPRMWRTLVVLKDPRSAFSEIPLKRPPDPPPQAVSQPQQSPRSIGWLIALWTIVAIAVGAGIYWVSTNLLRRQSERTPVKNDTV